MSKTLPVLVALGFVILLVAGCGVGGYNRVIAMDEDVKGAWAQVETQLQRRYDLIPNLVETVKGVADQEQEVFVGVAEARTRYQQAGSVADKASSASMLERALGRLIAVREAYPELKSNESFLKLQDQLEGSENRISVERSRYNDTVKSLNGYVRGFPGTLYASFAGVDQAEYFEVTDEAVNDAPAVSFD